MICPICHNDTWDISTRRCRTPTCPMGKHVEVIGSPGQANTYGQLVALDGVQYVVRVGGMDTKIHVPSWRIAWHPMLTAFALLGGRTLTPDQLTPPLNVFTGAPWQCQKCTAMNRRMHSYCFTCGTPRRVGAFDNIIMGGSRALIRGWLGQQIDLCNHVCALDRQFRPPMWATQMTSKLPAVMDHFLQCVEYDLAALLSLSSKKEVILEALQCPLLKPLLPGAHTASGPMLAWRFFDASDVGLMSSFEIDIEFRGGAATFRTQRSSEKLQCASCGDRVPSCFRMNDKFKFKFESKSTLSPMPIPKKSAQGTANKSLRIQSLKQQIGGGSNVGMQSLHQQGVKGGGGSQRSHFVSLTCSLPNLVHCTAGDFPCVPGGQVVPMIFGNKAVFDAKTPQLWKETTFAPFLGLFVLLPDEYSVDWSRSEADIAKNDPLVSYFEREVVFDTRRGSNPLRMETHLLLLYVNPFWQIVERK